MNASYVGLALILASFLALVGCNGATSDAPNATGTTAGKEYDIQGKVVAVGADKRSVTLDHEEIPGLMKGMEMKFNVEEPGIMTAIESGDQVAGKLRVKGSDYTITSLKKR